MRVDMIVLDNSLILTDDAYHDTHKKTVFDISNCSPCRVTSEKSQSTGKKDKGGLSHRKLISPFFDGQLKEKMENTERWRVHIGKNVSQNSRVDSDYL